MNKKAFWLAAILVAVSCQLTAHAAEVCRVPTADNFDEEGFFETSSFTKREAEIIALSRDLTSKSAEINAQLVEKLQAGDYAPSAELKEEIAAAEEDDEPSETATANEKLYTLPVKYHQVCPVWWHLVPKYRFYTRTVTYLSNGVKIYSFCFPYPRIWIARCRWKNCNIKNNVWYPYGFYYHCVPEFRPFRRWALCWEVAVSPSGGVKNYWSKKLIRIMIPVGCCCRGYFSLAPNICAAPAYTTAAVERAASEQLASKTYV